jgi:hypothetical protein
MTASALAMLDTPSGFMLVVEHEGPDSFGHSTDLNGVIDSVLEFRDAIDTAVAWAAGRTDTLIIVTSDHETGGLQITENNPVAGIVPGHNFTTTKHTGVAVPVFARGPGSASLSGSIDNTDFFPVLSSGIQVAPETISLQDGVQPDAQYYGTRDVTLSEAQPDVRLGLATSLSIDGDTPSGSGFDDLGLIQWDVSMIPPGSVVTNAVLSFDVTNGSSGTYDLFEVLRPWVESQATWNEALAGVPWQVPGARGVQDRGSVVLGSVAGSQVGTYSISLGAAGLATIQQWVDMPSSNHGMLLANAVETNGLDIASREVASTGDRPMLKITYLASTGIDSDGDGFSDSVDAFPLNPLEWADTDQDGIGNNADTDDDNDTVLDVDDAFPNDPAEWTDTDGDGIGNNADTDDDNDGILDVDDPFPLIPQDFDGDGDPDITDTDDDNDGMPDAWEDFYGLDSLDSTDAVVDGDLDGDTNLSEYQQDSHPRRIDVAATGQTAPMPPYVGETGDRSPADDPAIWIHPTDAAQSRIIGTDKQQGLRVYDLAGNEVQFLPDGQMNNVDLRYKVAIGGQLMDLVAATNRTDNTLVVYSVDAVTGLLSNVTSGGGINSGLDTRTR